MQISKKNSHQPGQQEVPLPISIKENLQEKPHSAIPRHQSAKRKTPFQLFVLALGTQGLARATTAQASGFTPGRPATGLVAANALGLLGVVSTGALTCANGAHTVPANPSQTSVTSRAARRSGKDQASNKVTNTINSQIDRLILGEPDLRPQSELPKHDDNVNSVPDDIRRTRSIVKWAKSTRPHETQNSGILEQFNIPFGLVQQQRMVNALVSASPTLIGWLKKAKDEQIGIKWGEFAFFNSDSKIITLPKSFDTNEKVNNELGYRIFRESIHFVSDLAHELAHVIGGAGKMRPNPEDYRSKSEFIRESLDYYAKEESKAIHGELTVAREIFNKIGVELKVGIGSYRSGKAQSIFHSVTLNSEQKMKALEHYVIDTHHGFEENGFYVADANDRWDKTQAIKEAIRKAIGDLSKLSEVLTPSHEEL